MATASFTIDGVRGRTASSRRFVVVQLQVDVHGVGHLPVLYRTDDVRRAVERAQRERAHVVDTIGKVKVRRHGEREWVEA